MTTKFSTRLNARSVWRRISYGVALLLVIALTGCGQIVPQIGNFDKTIPEALIGLDLGITEASAGKIGTNQQLTVTIYVNVMLDRDTITPDEVEKILTTISPLIDQPFASELELNIRKVVDDQSDDRIELNDAIQELNERWITMSGIVPEKTADYPFGVVGNDSTESLSDITIQLSDLREYVRLLEKQ